MNFFCGIPLAKILDSSLIVATLFITVYVLFFTVSTLFIMPGGVGPPPLKQSQVT
jgi:hypothetical protein